MVPNTMTPKRYELKSPNDGSVLAFEIRERLQEETTFDVSVKTPWFSGIADCSTFLVLSPADLFREMATEWMGWTEEKSCRRAVLMLLCRFNALCCLYGRPYGRVNGVLFLGSGVNDYCAGLA
jgi:hypothetical protein